MDLILDSAHGHGLVGLVEEGRVIVESQVERDAIAPALAELNSDFDRIIVGVGPGSYTGVRVGMALATGLHLAKGIPLVGVCSLCAYTPEGDGPFVSVVSAGPGGFYILEGEQVGDVITWGEPQQVPELPDRPLVGPDFSTVPSVLALSRAPHQKELCAIYLRSGVRGDRPAGGSRTDGRSSRK